MIQTILTCCYRAKIHLFLKWRPEKVATSSKFDVSVWSIITPYACVVLAFVLLGCPQDPTPWRSVLFPEDWTPAFTDAQGHFLHDFSYAGYKRGESDVPDTVPGAVYNVVTQFDADHTGAYDATDAIQAAIDAAAATGGGTVLLPEGIYRCDGLLSVRASGIKNKKGQSPFI